MTVNPTTPLSNEERIEAIGEQLRSKITSKFTASTFLAGFALTLLSGQVFALWDSSDLPGLFPISTGMMFGALAIFVSGVLALDALTMPKRFWEFDEREPPSGPNYYLTDGDLWKVHDQMVFVWLSMIVAASAITALAMMAMLIATEPLKIEDARRNTVWWAVGGVVGATLYSRALIALMVKKYGPLVRGD